MEIPKTARTEVEQDSKRKWIVLLAIGIGAFMSSLDGSVVNIILPVLTKELHSDVAAIQWVVVVYLLVVSGLLLTFGRLGDLRGHKSIYILGYGIFILGSMFCGMATTTGALVAFRAFQAIGAAVLTANSPAILTHNFPASQRGRALGLQSAMVYLGLTIGPSLGGWLATNFGWRVVFYINVPVGLAAFLLSLWFIPADAPRVKDEKFDLPGSVIFMAGLIALMLGLNRGHDWGWASPAILGLLALALALLVFFIYVQQRAAFPMLDLTLFRKRIFSASLASALLNYVAVNVVIFTTPFFLIQGRGLNAAQAGMVMTAQPLVMAMVAPISGALSDRIGSRILATSGSLVLACGLLWLSRLSASSPLPYVAAGLAISGLGSGLFASPNTSAILGAAPRHRQGIAAGMTATGRNVGMVLGVGLAGAIYTTLATQPGANALVHAVNVGFGVAVIVALMSGAASIVRGSENGE